jgi:hypothetical protein
VKSDATHPCCTKDQAPEANVDGGSRTLGDKPSLDKAQRVRLARVTRSWNILRSASLRTCRAFISLLGPYVSLPRFRALRTGFRAIQSVLPCDSKTGQRASCAGEVLMEGAFPQTRRVPVVTGEVDHSWALNLKKWGSWGDP